MRRLRSLSVTLVAVAALAGCSDSGDGGDGAPEGDAASTGVAVTTVDATEALALLDDRADVEVIDVRTPEEHAEGHLADAQLLDFSSGEFEAALDDLDPDGAYLLYCRTGNRSGQAAELMAERGFDEVYDAGAFDDLAAAGAPT